MAEPVNESGRARRRDKVHPRLTAGQLPWSTSEKTEAPGRFAGGGRRTLPRTAFLRRHLVAFAPRDIDAVQPKGGGLQINTGLPDNVEHERDTVDQRPGWDGIREG